MIQKAVGFAFVFALAPFCTGLLYGGQMGKKRRITHIYLAGFLTCWAAFQLIAVPILIQKAFGMKYLVPAASILYGLLSAAGLIRAFISWKKEKLTVWQVFGLTELGKIRENGWISLGFWTIALGLVALQVYMAFTRAMFDGDDAYYVVQSVLADQTGTLNRILPYTGLSSELDIRHSLATLPLWIAYAARMTGIHATIVAHSLLPLVLIPLTYLCYYEIARRLPGISGEKLPIFLALASILQIWGNTSSYTNATFFLMRTWQGKSVLANLILLNIIWLLLEIFSEKEKRYRRGFWALLAVNNVCAAMMTSMGAFLAALLIAVIGLIAALRFRRFSLLPKLAACCIPNIFYLVLLVFLPALL